MNTRAAAIKILNSLPFPYHNYEQEIRNFLEKKDFSQSDGDFIHLLVKGVIIYHKFLDYIISLSYRRSLKKLENVALNCLRVGVFQIVKLGLPAYAVVNETVEAAHQLGYSRLAGLLNAVLRHIPPEENWRSELQKYNEDEALAIEYSHPEWLVKRWLENYGRETTIKLLRFNNEYQDIIWRINPLLTEWSFLESALKDDGYQIEIVSKTPQVFFRVNEPGRLYKSHFFKTGKISVQDYGQALAVELLAPQPGEEILDVCAAPGGKTTYMAQLTANKAKIYASDISKERLNLLANEIERLGVRIELLKPGDAAKVKFPKVDKILIDAPCTGTGVIARRANLRWNRKPEDLEIMPKQQLAILNNVARYLKDGGVLVYSTCSLEDEENWAVIQDFINLHPEFIIERADKFVPELYCDEFGAVSVLPFKHGLTGSFAVRLVKTSGIV